MSEGRIDYEMTENDLREILEASRPVPYIMVCGLPPVSAQDRANHAWERLGAKMGFVYTSVRTNGRGDRSFSAIPSKKEIR